MKINKLFFLAIAGIFSLASCSNDIESNSYTPKGDYDSGILVLNEGKFSDDNDAEVTYLSFDLSEVNHEIFKTENPTQELGDVAQSIGFNGDLAYIVVNNSNKIEVVNRYTFKKVGSINSGLSFPRYIAFANGKAFVTNWNSQFGGSGYVSVINLASNSVESTITVADNPNKIIEQNGKLYVAHNDLGQLGNSITVIDPTSLSVSGSIAVGDRPDMMQVDDSGFLWVSCNGKSSYPVAADENAGKIVKIDLSSQTVLKTFTLSENTLHVDNFSVYGNNLFYTVGKDVFKMPLTATDLPTTKAFTSSAQSIYGFAVRNNRIYIADAKSYNENGQALIYSSGDGGVAIGTLLRTIETDVIPNGFYFNL
ncbi:MAG: YncE family protein [Flavobacteriaceae bacterium]